jgi:hypothetical protein
MTVVSVGSWASLIVGRVEGIVAILITVLLSDGHAEAPQLDEQDDED